MKHLRLAFAGLCLALLAACSTTAVTPLTFNQDLLVGYSTVTGIATTAQSLRAAGRLSEADRANVVATNQAAIASLDLANQMHATDATAGANKLTATLTVLNGLKLYLSTAGASK